jgi:excisionase family DNA binding protein
VLGELERAKAVLWARLTAPSPPLGRTLTVQEAAALIRHSPDWLYRNHARLPFARKVGRRVLVDEAALRRWLAARAH